MKKIAFCSRNGSQCLAQPALPLCLILSCACWWTCGSSGLRPVSYSWLSSQHVAWNLAHSWCSGNVYQGNQWIIMTRPAAKLVDHKPAAVMLSGPHPTAVSGKLIRQVRRRSLASLVCTSHMNPNAYSYEPTCMINLGSWQEAVNLLSKFVFYKPDVRYYYSSFPLIPEWSPLCSIGNEGYGIYTFYNSWIPQPSISEACSKPGQGNWMAVHFGIHTWT